MTSEQRKDWFLKTVGSFGSPILSKMTKGGNWRTELSELFEQSEPKKLDVTRFHRALNYLQDITFRHLDLLEIAEQSEKFSQFYRDNLDRCEAEVSKTFNAKKEQQAQELKTQQIKLKAESIKSEKKLKALKQEVEQAAGQLKIIQENEEVLLATLRINVPQSQVISPIIASVEKGYIVEDVTTKAKIYYQRAT